MDKVKIIKTMNQYINTSKNILLNWLLNKLPKLSLNWWEDCVLDKLNDKQKYNLENEKFSNFDFDALLDITNKNWYALCETNYLPTNKRECFAKMLEIKNNWINLKNTLPCKDIIVLDINTLLEFLKQIDCDMELYNEVKEFLCIIKELNYEETTELTTNIDEILTKNSLDNEIKEKDLVYLISDPTQKGVVLSIQKIENLNKYQVFLNGELRTFVTGQISLCTPKLKYNWVDLSTFKTTLSSYQINNPSSSNLYSLNSARIDFVPYQFRPALKIINSEEPRILIADSVGVGKTIEAGLIIKELDARDELQKIMIICPKPLVAEHKWLNEMRRFDEEFEELDGQNLRQLISDMDMYGEWSPRHNKLIVPYSILDSRVYEGEKDKLFQCCGLKKLDPAPHFDLVIIDEAHHIRNGSMTKEKAYAYKCVKYFCEHADAVVMLTATPLQNSDDDLFTLLNLLQPQIVIDKDIFKMMSDPNKYISECSHILRTHSKNWGKEALNTLIKINTTQWGKNVIAKNPKYEKAIKVLNQEEISREERVELINDIESLHSFNSMINRTRRKDIQDFCVRRNHTIKTHFTNRQKELHDELLKFEEITLSKLHDSRLIPFMTSMIKRQASSCIFGLAPYIKDIINRRLVQIADNDGLFVENNNLEKFISILGESAQNLLHLAENLPIDDPKFDSMFEIILKKQSLENNKIILFSTFKHTLYYIKVKLIQQGIRVEQIDGSVKDEDRWELRKRFELPKEDINALDILLFTEVGSEGLDYQFCDMMINYDLPWNPMRIEQRIGRIDRRGQTSEVVNIYNIITDETIDADIYNRCLLRIGIFEQSIGECEEILGKIASKIENIATDTSLTNEERRIKLETMADNEVRKIQEMNRLENEAKGLFGFDLSNYMYAKEVQKCESPWLSPKNLQCLVEKYLNERLGKKTYIWGNEDIKSLRLSKEARNIIKEDFRKLTNVRSVVRQQWEQYLKGIKPNLKITFIQETAEKNRDVQFITTIHPLVKQAAKYFETNQQININISTYSSTIQKGIYPFSVYVWKFVGIKPKTEIKVFCENEDVVLEWNEIIQKAKTIPFDNNMTISWDKLEIKNIKEWEIEKQKYIEDLKSEITFKLETIKNNFNRIISNLEKKIKDNNDEKIIRMYQSMIEDETEKYKLKKQDLKRKNEQADIYFTLITNGVLTIN
ncbi:MAG: DEAD/DEAH box helicase [Clostridia bacterium]|nr:DEAD/DEAH box helicase [Clostridia bacterium]